MPLPALIVLAWLAAGVVLLALLLPALRLAARADEAERRRRQGPPGEAGVLVPRGPVGGRVRRGAG